MKLYGVELNEKQYKAAKKIIRNRVKEEQAAKVDRLAEPVYAEPRYRWDEDGYTVTEYGYLWDMTEEEMEEWKREEWRHGNLLYDCTGELCTRWIDFHRNPCGVISYRHFMVVDL